jgi:hypothetical protein
MPKSIIGQKSKYGFLAVQTLFVSIALPIAPANSEDFHGLVCYDGCANLKAGYNWARDRDNRDSNACMGRGADYEKGCSMYVYEAGPAPPPPRSDGQKRENAEDKYGSGSSLDPSR